MEIFKFLKDVKNTSFSMLESAFSSMGAGVGYIQSMIGEVRFLGSIEASSSYDDEERDEKHYFLIPDHLSELEYSLYAMRCLPEDVPPVNDLPKHRIFHLPNKNAMATVEYILLKDAREEAVETSIEKSAISMRASELADQIDQLDNKAFNGALVLGGLVALINPVAGATLAAKAMLPSVGMLLSKYGLKYAGETVDSMVLEKRIKDAENDVLKQFEGTNTETIVNPILSVFDSTLRSSNADYDPVAELYTEHNNVEGQESDRFLHLTAQAITNSYENILEFRELRERANIDEVCLDFLGELKAISEQH